MTASHDQAPPTRAEELLRLDSQICFALHAASRAFSGVYRTALRELELTYPQYLVMLVLWESDGVPVKEIGARLRLDSGTLSPLLKRLEAAGLIRRLRSEQDERSVEIHLSAAGEALRERALDVPRQIADATGMPVAELKDLRARVAALTAAIDGVQAQGESCP
ncbi:MarR family winged helix-turn-helix transcriptional regulator [Amycolatopsis magusensis]|uniref:DNA-binding MarR family transcriptional regulator n=1 Tax=Amycolatopsis magusensis TaxID=882444 RepID=A0ABS4PV93_9PSEU|nr:MarR family transcriptional regulator [Amycolatopsis magusensis]MBP2183347.1 DNA-binding MarR family transcriptional regulator [Amycolatopsis magusensis]MDI5981174.1 MarR family transcriptional regulator [Amycolatopsis magusensis]